MSALWNFVKVLILAGAVSFAMANAAQAKSCSALVQDLQAMQQAQNTLLDTLVRSNLTMASTLDQYSESLRFKTKVRTSDILGLKKSAQAFRTHQDRESKLVQRFQAKANQLLSQVQECLKAKTIASKE